MSEKIARLNKTSLCYQCGTCAAACKAGCIKMGLDTRKGMVLPEIDDTKCSNCGLCEKVCPILNLEGPKDQFQTLSTGIYYAADKSLFEASSSGGATGAILKYLFESDSINCAVVTGIAGIYARPQIIRSIDEISNIQGSKYQPVALNTILSEIQEGDRFALVGLPCHINGLRRIAKKIKLLDDRLVLAIGVYCSIGRSMFSTHAALGRSFNDGNLCYRHGEHPGNFGFLANDKFTQVSTYKYLLEQFDYFFYPKGCHYCDDLYNVYADISIGDAWGLECGKSAIVMARTNIGDNVVTCAEKNGVLKKIKDASREDNHATQKHSYHYKITNYFARLKTIAAFTDPILSEILPDSKKENKILPSYFLLFILTVLFNTRAGFMLVTNNVCRKFLLKIRNRLLRYVA